MVRKVKRRVSCLPKATYFKPREIPLCDLELVKMTVEELEVIRLCDLLQMEQNDAADMMGVSRKTFWTDLQKARQKVADALVNGKAIEISGGEYVNAGECKSEFMCSRCGMKWDNESLSSRPENCPGCSSCMIYRTGGDGKGKRMLKNGLICPKVVIENDKACNTIDEQ